MVFIASVALFRYCATRRDESPRDSPASIQYSAIRRLLLWLAGFIRAERRGRRRGALEVDHGHALPVGLGHVVGEPLDGLDLLCQIVGRLLHERNVARRNLGGCLAQTQQLEVTF